MSVELRQGEVLGLLGANGAGKSTLIRVLSGVLTPDEGRVTIDGAAVKLGSTRAARDAGIETVHQRIGEQVAPGLSVAENLVLDDLLRPGSRILLQRSQILSKARAAAEALGLHWSDRMLRNDVADLSLSDQQLLSLARALAHRPRVLILDEPTSALSATEADRLFDMVRTLAGDGLSVVFVSHRLGEVDALADRIVVLREGRVTNEQQQPFQWRAALGAMLGEEAASHTRVENPKRGGEVVLRVRGAKLTNADVRSDIDVRAGEVLGVVGLLGAGKTELAHGIFGAAHLDVHEILLAGNDFRPKSPSASIAEGVYLVPEDRTGQGVLPQWSVATNLSLPFLGSVSSWGVLRRPRERGAARDVINELGIVASSESASIETLSGGNQQKVVVGRWLSKRPRLLLLDEPFRGVDIGARRDIGARARSLAAQGAAVVVLAADVDEILEVADRIVILDNGRVTGDEYADNVTRSEIVSLMSKVAS